MELNKKMVFKTDQFPNCGIGHKIKLLHYTILIFYIYSLVFLKIFFLEAGSNLIQPRSAYVNMIGVTFIFSEILPSKNACRKNPTKFRTPLIISAP